MHPTAEPIEALDGTPHHDEKGSKGDHHCLLSLETAPWQEAKGIVKRISV
jgi:hypothetical protein